MKRSGGSTKTRTNEFEQVEQRINQKNEDVSVGIIQLNRNVHLCSAASAWPDGLYHKSVMCYL